MFDDLIDLASSPPKSRQKAIDDSKESQENGVWDIAQELSLLDINNLSQVNPISQEQITNALQRRMPDESQPATRNLLEIPNVYDHPRETKSALKASTVEERPHCQPCRTLSKPLYFCNIGRVGFLTKKTDEGIARKIETVLKPITDDEHQALFHLQNEGATWFGVTKDEYDTMIFQDYGRYADLMAEKSSKKRGPRYPGLVSFVGDGKSTLIKILIKLKSRDKDGIPAPVIGSVLHQDIPTSGDVYLYCDPETFESENPMLYSDCEGLDGGEREPMGAKSRGLKWLLYTFSDVIVYVLKNPRVIENVITQLIDWAATALKKSSNQPSLPHAILVLNESDNNIDKDRWDVDNATSSTPWPIFIKPARAGVRILTLDGGGIRGIVELEVLRQIESVWDNKLSIQAFVDLIVGTSTGGLIALDLGAKGWSVKKCSKFFERLCHSAFTKRKGIGFPGIEFIVAASNYSRYETQPLENTLKEAFGDDVLFGGLRTECKSTQSNQITKVAVTSTTTSGKAVVGEAADEMKIWEAARATSAAPRIFKSFFHSGSRQLYLDGALYHNNPINIADRERKLIWPDVLESYPDVILSIGTGVSENSKADEVPAKPSHRGIISHLKALTKIAVDHIASSLDSEQKWKEYMAAVSPPRRYKDRSIRLNLHLDGDPPKLDDVDSLEDLQGMTRRYFMEEQNKVSIQDVADHLLATSFYFESVSVIDLENGWFRCSGKIYCRFANMSNEIGCLGKVLKERRKRIYNTIPGPGDYDPYFVIQERHREKEGSKVILTSDVVDTIVEESKFSMQLKFEVANKTAETTIELCLDDDPGNLKYYPISGFPRCLYEENTNMGPKIKFAPPIMRRRTENQISHRFSSPSLIPQTSILIGSEGDASIDNPENLERMEPSYYPDGREAFRMGVDDWLGTFSPDSTFVSDSSFAMLPTSRSPQPKDNHHTSHESLKGSQRQLKPSTLSRFSLPPKLLKFKKSRLSKDYTSAEPNRPLLELDGTAITHLDPHQQQIYELESDIPNRNNLVPVSGTPFSPDSIISEPPMAGRSGRREVFELETTVRLGLEEGTTRSNSQGPNPRFAVSPPNRSSSSPSQIFAEENPTLLN
ncbi:MAG: hypothetical protein M1834_003053 [Cirrosporium novae-zelandiae]|nr:MAG: hypothetical protein M1834_003053 [Cirrosporium novae-zelandiae]